MDCDGRSASSVENGAGCACGDRAGCPLRAAGEDAANAAEVGCTS
jgi:hypothetical protein